MKNNNALRRAGLAAVVLGGIWSGLPAQADNMSFHGRLIEQAPCTVNDNEDVQVEFGDVQVRLVDGVAYEHTVELVMKCGVGEIIKVVLTHIGTATSFNPAAVQTNIADFGIQLSVLNNNSGPLNVGSSVVTHPGDGTPTHIMLTVVPVKKAGATLQTGVFNGVSTLRLDYP